MRRRVLTRGSPAGRCLTVAGVALMQVACAAPASVPGKARACPEVRPEACTMEYRPVTGYSPSGEPRGQFSNACTACAEPGVAYTVPKNR